MNPIPMLIWCPECGKRHIDEAEFATKAHHTHACQHCGHCWRPAVVPTCGVQFLPGFKNVMPNGEVRGASVTAQPACEASSDEGATSTVVLCREGETR